MRRATPKDGQELANNFGDEGRFETQEFCVIVCQISLKISMA